MENPSIAKHCWSNLWVQIDSFGDGTLTATRPTLTVGAWIAQCLPVAWDSPSSSLHYHPSPWKQVPCKLPQVSYNLMNKQLNKLAAIFTNFSLVLLELLIFVYTYAIPWSWSTTGTYPRYLHQGTACTTGAACPAATHRTVIASWLLAIIQNHESTNQPQNCHPEQSWGYCKFVKTTNR